MEASFAVLSALFVLMSGRVSPKLVSVLCVVLFCIVLSFADLACELSVRKFRFPFPRSVEFLTLCPV